MAEIKRPYKSVLVSYICDKCEEGEMLPTGYSFTTNPPSYGHRCNKCGEIAYMRHTYPKIEYIPLEDN